MAGSEHNADYRANHSADYNADAPLSASRRTVLSVAGATGLALMMPTHKILAQRDGIDIHENLLGIKIPAQPVVEASGRPLTFLSTIADENWAAHFCPLAICAGNIETLSEQGS
jgi:hypothetical protein